MLNNYENEVICGLTSPWRPPALLPESGDDSHLITSRAPARSISEHLGIWTFGQTTLIRNSRAPPRLTAALLSPRLGSWPAAGDGGGGNAANSEWEGSVLLGIALQTSMKCVGKNTLQENHSNTLHHRSLNIILLNYQFWVKLIIQT